MRSLLDTPSDGVNEVYAALRLARGHDGNYVAPTELLRHFAPHTSLTGVQTILTAAVGANVQTSGGKYRLTAAGVTYSRANRPRGTLIPVS